MKELVIISKKKLLVTATKLKTRKSRKLWHVNKVTNLKLTSKSTVYK